MNNTDLFIGDVKISELTEDITIIYPTYTEDLDTGEMVQTWTIESDTKRARVRYNGMSEDEKSGAVRSIESVLFTTYYDSTVNTKDKVSYSGRLYDIISVIPNGRNRFMTITAKNRESYGS
jgi:SPP1 family predicted phage head-tail adaptor